MPAAQHNMTSAQIVKRGSAYSAADTVAGKERGSRGVVFSHVLYYSFGSPIVGAANNICTSQAVTVGTTPLAVINGALASGGVATTDHARNVVAAWTGTSVITITGTDMYGKAVRESSASGTSLTGKKAFKTITSVSFSADVTAATVGTGDVLGLPYVSTIGDVITARGGAAVDTGTHVVADATSPATATTGDVRGTFDPSTTLNGSTEIQVLLHVPVSDNSAYGVAQFAG